MDFPSSLTLNGPCSLSKPSNELHPGPPFNHNTTGSCFGLFCDSTNLLGKKYFVIVSCECKKKQGCKISVDLNFLLFPLSFAWMPLEMNMRVVNLTVKWYKEIEILNHEPIVELPASCCLQVTGVMLEIWGEGQTRKICNQIFVDGCFSKKRWHCYK